MPPTSSDRLLAAAVACFSAKGLNVSMEDVATRAGVTRRTLYRAYPDRRALVEAVAISRLDRIIAKVRPLLEAQTHLADALVTGFVEFVRQARADKVFIAALNEASEWQLERFLVGPNEAFHQRAETLWQAPMARATRTHEWRPGLDAAKVNAWLRAVAVILLLRDDLDENGQAELVRSFVIPALVAPKVPARQGKRASAASRRIS